MIKRQTVFVLGAGASQAYGFPSGAELVDRICKRLEDPDGEAARTLSSLGHNIRNQLAAFRRRLKESRLNSIDAFLQRRQEYEEVGKAAIAQELLQYETDALLFTSRECDWYRMLFNEILPSNANDFDTDLYNVITFNFDRSFEHALFRSLESLFDNPEESFAGGRNRPVEMLKRFPLLHVHGQLGTLGYSPGNATVRPYCPASDAPTIEACARQLRIVYDGALQEALDTAHEWLLEAEVVCFLGFGCHELNLERLDVRRTLRGKRRVWGTRCGLGAGFVTKTSRIFEAINWVQQQWTIVDLLNETEVIHV